MQKKTDILVHFCMIMNIYAAFVSQVIFTIKLRETLQWRENRVQYGPESGICRVFIADFHEGLLKLCAKIQNPDLCKCLSDVVERNELCVSQVLHAIDEKIRNEENQAFKIGVVVMASLAVSAAFFVTIIRTQRNGRENEGDNEIHFFLSPLTSLKR